LIPLNPALISYLKLNSGAMKKRIIILILSFPFLVFAHQGGHYESGNIRKDRPFGISANIGGGNLLGISLDYFIIPQLNIEVGFGFGQYAALKYHFEGGEEIKWSPYIGLGYGIPVSDIRTENIKYSNGVIAIPVGVQQIQKGGFSFSIEAVIGILHYKDQSDYSNPVEKTELFPSFGISLGYHFKKP
jgi:hypothetical protein